jgi:hypothetical protein
MTLHIPFFLSLLMIPFSFTLAYINYEAIKRQKVGFWWHNIQFFLLFIVGFFALKFLNLPLAEKINVLFILAFSHWILFDTFLNIQRGLPYDYVGYTSTIDRSVRYLFEGLGEANMRTLFFVVKLYFWFGSLVIHELIFGSYQVF